MPVLPPPALALGAAVVQHVLAPEEGTGVLRKGAAAGLAAASMGLAGAAFRRFGERGTTVEPFHPERASSLVVDGPNALTRNPMYVGLAGVLAAHALARGGLRTWLPVAAFVAVIDRFQIRPEEAALAGLFGADYDAYRLRVPRWVAPLH